jgi:hypothetical protein
VACDQAKPVSLKNEDEPGQGVAAGIFFKLYSFEDKVASWTTFDFDFQIIEVSSSKSVKKKVFCTNVTRQEMGHFYYQDERHSFTSAHDN